MPLRLAGVPMGTTSGVEWIGGFGPAGIVRPSEGKAAAGGVGLRSVWTASVSLAGHPRPVGDSCERGDAPTDIAGAGTRSLRSIPPTLSYRRSLCSRVARRRGAGVGRARVQPPGPESLPRRHRHGRAPSRTRPRRSEGPVCAARRRALHGTCRPHLRIRDRPRRRGRERGESYSPCHAGGDPLPGPSAGVSRRAGAARSRLAVEPVPHGDRRRGMRRPRSGVRTLSAGTPLRVGEIGATAARSRCAPNPAEPVCGIGSPRPWPTYRRHAGRTGVAVSFGPRLRMAGRRRTRPPSGAVPRLRRVGPTGPGRSGDAFVTQLRPGR
jgi:hypothetical protein